jgi:hypothetical protein
VEKFPDCPRLILLLKRSLKVYYFVTKIVVFNLFIALLNFSDIVCGCEILTGSDYWKTSIYPPPIQEAL